MLLLPPHLASPLPRYIPEVEYRRLQPMGRCFSGDLRLRLIRYFGYWYLLFDIFLFIFTALPWPLPFAPFPAADGKYAAAIGFHFRHRRFRYSAMLIVFFIRFIIVNWYFDKAVILVFSCLLLLFCIALLVFSANAFRHTWYQIMPFQMVSLMDYSFDGFITSAMRFYFVSQYVLWDWAFLMRMHIEFLAQSIQIITRSSRIRLGMFSFPFVFYSYRSAIIDCYRRAPHRRHEASLSLLALARLVSFLFFRSLRHSLLPLLISHIFKQRKPAQLEYINLVGPDVPVSLAVAWRNKTTKIFSIAFIFESFQLPCCIDTFTSHVIIIAFCSIASCRAPLFITPQHVWFFISSFGCHINTATHDITDSIISYLSH